MVSLIVWWTPSKLHSELVQPTDQSCSGDPIETQNGEAMRRKCVVAFGLALAFGLLSISPDAFADDSPPAGFGAAIASDAPFPSGDEIPSNPRVEQGCPPFNVCVYQFQNFEGARAMRECQFAGESLGGVYRSARNRCGPGGRSNVLKLGLSIIACMIPGGDRPSPGAFSSIFIFADPGPKC